MTPLLNLADVELAQLIATSALLPVEKRAAFVERVAAALVAGETSLLNAIAAAQRRPLQAGIRDGGIREARSRCKRALRRPEGNGSLDGARRHRR